MKPLRKALLVVAAVLLVLVGSAGLWLALFFQPNDYRDVFSNYVYRQTGRELTINGEVRFGFGWGADGRLQIQIAAERLELFNRAYLPDGPIVTAGWLELEIRLLPILRGHWSIANAVVERPQINLVRLANGRSNWEDLALLGLLPVDHVRGYGGRLTWTNRLSEQTVTLTGVDWLVKPVSGGKTADIELTFRTPNTLVGRPLSVRLAARIPRTRDAGEIFPFQRLAADIAGSGLVATVQLFNGTIDLT
ncbi:MAG: AsmA family protein, partial [Pseudomonadota bacterium]|nr:AsmA family protein [Pseudomonadota bacterium]